MVELWLQLFGALLLTTFIVTIITAQFSLMERPVRPSNWNGARGPAALLYAGLVVATATGYIGLQALGEFMIIAAIVGLVRNRRRSSAQPPAA